MSLRGARAKFSRKMFDFERLIVYRKTLQLVKQVLSFLALQKDVDDVLADQLKRAVTSILFNLAEGTGRESSADKRRFYTMARSSAYESAAILQVILQAQKIESEDYSAFYGLLEEISKMLLALIRQTK